MSSPVEFSSREELLALVGQQAQVIADQQHIIADQQQFIADQQRLLADVQVEVAALRVAVVRLREELGRKGEPPSWAKPKTPQRAKTPRKKRAHGYGRACMADPEIVEHAVDVCPDCGHPLTGGWAYSSHEEIDLPLGPVRVVRHVRLMRRCGVCGRRVVPPRMGSVGQHRFSARFMSVVSYWHILGRLPLRIIQQVLHLLYRVSVSVGELRAMLDAVAAAGAASYGELKQAIRGSPVVQADETSWREDGQHGYLWAVITPTIRYFERHPSRSGQVICDILGENFTGICGCDGYSGYNVLDCWKQRCWVHLRRHGHRLAAKYPEATEAHAWLAEMRAIYDSACALLATPGYAALPAAEREAHRLACERRLQTHAQPACQAEIKEWRNLATFLLNHLNELFVFVQHPEVPSHNNDVERAVRGPVTARKICGGTRSKQGSDSKMTLFSLLQTCQVRSIDPVAAIEGLLLGQPLFAAT